MAVYPRVGRANRMLLPVWLRMEYNLVVNPLNVLASVSAELRKMQSASESTGMKSSNANAPQMGGRWRRQISLSNRDESEVIRDLSSIDPKKVACMAERGGTPSVKDPSCSPKRCAKSSPSGTPMFHLYSFMHQSNSTREAAEPESRPKGSSFSFETSRPSTLESGETAAQWHEANSATASTSSRPPPKLMVREGVRPNPPVRATSSKTLPPVASVPAGNTSVPAAHRVPPVPSSAEIPAQKRTSGPYQSRPGAAVTRSTDKSVSPTSGSENKAASNSFEGAKAVGSTASTSPTPAACPPANRGGFLPSSRCRCHCEPGGASKKHPVFFDSRAFASLCRFFGAEGDPNVIILKKLNSAIYGLNIPVDQRPSEDAVHEFMRDFQFVFPPRTIIVKEEDRGSGKPSSFGTFQHSLSASVMSQPSRSTYRLPGNLRERLKNLGTKLGVPGPDIQNVERALEMSNEGYFGFIVTSSADVESLLNQLALNPPTLRAVNVKGSQGLSGVVLESGRCRHGEDSAMFQRILALAAAGIPGDENGPPLSRNGEIEKCRSGGAILRRIVSGDIASVTPSTQKPITGMPTRACSSLEQSPELCRRRESSGTKRGSPTGSDSAGGVPHERLMGGQKRLLSSPHMGAWSANRERRASEGGIEPQSFSAQFSGTTEELIARPSPSVPSSAFPTDAGPSAQVDAPRGSDRSVPRGSPTSDSEVEQVPQAFRGSSDALNCISPLIGPTRMSRLVHDPRYRTMVGANPTGGDVPENTLGQSMWSGNNFGANPGSVNNPSFVTTWEGSGPVGRAREFERFSPVSRNGCEAQSAGADQISTFLLREHSLGAAITHLANSLEGVLERIDGVAREMTSTLGTEQSQVVALRDIKHELRDTVERMRQQATRMRGLSVRSCAASPTSMVGGNAYETITRGKTQEESGCQTEWPHSAANTVTGGSSSAAAPQPSEQLSRPNEGSGAAGHSSPIAGQNPLAFPQLINELNFLIQGGGSGNGPSGGGGSSGGTSVIADGPGGDLSSPALEETAGFSVEASFSAEGAGLLSPDLQGQVRLQNLDASSLSERRLLSGGGASCMAYGRASNFSPYDIPQRMHPVRLSPAEGVQDDWRSQPASSCNGRHVSGERAPSPSTDEISSCLKRASRPAGPLFRMTESSPRGKNGGTAQTDTMAARFTSPNFQSPAHHRQQPRMMVTSYDDSFVGCNGGAAAEYHHPVSDPQTARLGGLPTRGFVGQSEGPGRGFQPSAGAAKYYQDFPSTNMKYAGWPWPPTSSSYW